MSPKQATAMTPTEKAEAEYYECIRHFSSALRERVESNEPPITEEDGAKLNRAKELFDEWARVQSVFRSRRSAT